MRRHALEGNAKQDSRRSAWFLLGAAGSVALFWWAQTRAVWTQAGYLHLAFARSLAEGHGFGPGYGTFFGDGSPVWLALLVAVSALLRPLTSDWLIVGKIAAVGAVLFFAAGLWCFAGELVAETEMSVRRSFAASAVLLVLLSPYWGEVAFSGSEAVLAAGLACWGLRAVAGGPGKPLHPARLLAGCLCAGLAPLLRPDMLLFSFCLAPFLFLRWVVTPLAWRTKALVFFAGLALAVTPGVGWLLYTVHRFGTALPNTLIAGRAAPEDSVLAQWVLRESFGYPWVSASLLAGFVFIALRMVRQQGGPSRGAEPEFWRSLDPVSWAVPVWFILSAGFGLVLHQRIRIEDLTVTAPALTACALAELRRLRPRLFALGLPAAAVYGMATSLCLTVPAVRGQAANGRVYARLAEVVRGLPSPEAVVMEPVGEVAFLSQHRVVGLDGSLEPAAAGFSGDIGDDRRVWWAQGQGARSMVLEHAPEPGSQLLWSCPLPPVPWDSLFRSTDFPLVLRLWRLPPSPTLRPPLRLPTEADLR